MRVSWLAGLLCPAALLAACGTTAPPAETAEDISGLLPDVVIAAPGAGRSARDARVTVNDPKALAAAQADLGDRIVITAMRSALRTGSLDAYLRALSDQSCPKGTRSRSAEAIDISATPIAMQPSDPSQRRIGSLTYVAGFELSSSDPRFGGLSGIEVLDNGSLLALSDGGYFIWLDLAADGLTPARARLSALRDTSGLALSGVAGDSAEGLAVNDGTVLVSFEGNHRVLAFDIGKCGAAARGAPIVFGNYGLSLSEAYEESRIAVEAGSGSEPLGVTKDWYVLAGIERKVGHLNSLSARPIEAEPEFDLKVGVDAPEFTGIDILPRSNDSVRAFLIHRAAGARNGPVWVTETDLLRYEDRTRDYSGLRGEMGARARQRYSEIGWRELAQLSQVGIVDRFEGIAAKELSDGRVRLFLVSDDDYAADSRTALMVFDLAPVTR